MARKNKKRRSGGFLVPPPFAVTLIVLSILSLCYLWLRGRCDALGQELKNLENRKAALEKNLSYEQSRWSNLKSPQNIEQTLRKHQLVMTWPSRDQIVRLVDSGSLAATGDASYDVTHRMAMND